MKLKTLVSKIEWPPAGTYVVAVSGGVDSVALLDLLVAYNLDGRYDLVVAHLDHGMRGSSAADALLAHNLATQYGLSFYLESAKLGPGATEEAARHARYTFLRELASRVEAAGIMTAHHFDDRLETVIINQLRGANRHGLAPLRSRGDLWRPLAGLRKSELYTYARERGLRWREDETNQDTSLRRNLIRQQLSWPGSGKLENQMMGAVQRLDAINDQLDAYFRRWLKQAGHSFEGLLYLSLSFLRRLEPSLRQHFLYFVVRELDPAIRLNRSIVERLSELALRPDTGKAVLINSYITAWKDYEYLVLGNPAEPAAAMPLRDLEPGQTQEVNGWRLSLLESPTARSRSFRAHRVHVRSWRFGDRVYPLGLKGSKKLQDVFVDQKISRRLRRIWPVLVDERDRVLWVPGLVVDRRALAIDAPAGVLHLEIEVVR